MRIRTIKPEFWASESVGRLSRDARLVFIGLWSLADDAGRFRASVTHIAGQLLSYDDDGAKVVRRALEEMQREGMVVLYEAGGNHYGALTGWKSHQRIDKPGQSRIPQPPENSLANIREDSENVRESSCLDRKGREGKGTGSGEEGTGRPPTTPVVVVRPSKPEAEWLAEDFWLWAQDRRQASGHIAEVRQPKGLSSWYSTALQTLGGDVERLKEAFYRYGDDAYWERRTPPLPFGGFVSQWTKYVPQGVARVGA